MIQDLLTEGAKTGDLRDDVAPDELASYCLHALTAAGSLSSKAAVRRLVTVTLAGLRPRSPQSPGGLCRACDRRRCKRDCGASSGAINDHWPGDRLEGPASTCAAS
jgi:hypothetical protein